MVRSSGFISIYLLPLFLAVIFIALDCVYLSNDAKKISSNYMSTVSTLNIADLGLKHGIIAEKNLLKSHSYYLNVIDNSIVVLSNINSRVYSKVNIKVSSYFQAEVINGEKIMVEYREVTVNSKGYVDNYSKTLTKSYKVRIGVENTIDTSTVEGGII
ncbi:MAG: hypothetical protein RR840_05905 [Clostridium sp.]